MCAAAMTQDASNVDLLGFHSANPDGLPLFWFDSEQSPDDFWHGVNRAVQRAGLTTPPAWLHAFCLTGFGHKIAWECVKHALNQAASSQPEIPFCLAGRPG